MTALLPRIVNKELGTQSALAIGCSQPSDTWGLESLGTRAGIPMGACERAAPLRERFLIPARHCGHGQRVEIGRHDYIGTIPLD